MRNVNVELTTGRVILVKDVTVIRIERKGKNEGSIIFTHSNGTKGHIRAGMWEGYKNAN